MSVFYRLGVYIDFHSKAIVTTQDVVKSGTHVVLISMSISRRRLHGVRSQYQWSSYLSDGVWLAGRWFKRGMDCSFDE